MVSIVHPQSFPLFFDLCLLLIQFFISTNFGEEPENTELCPVICYDSSCQALLSISVSVDVTVFRTFPETRWR